MVVKSIYMTTGFKHIISLLVGFQLLFNISSNAAPHDFEVSDYHRDSIFSARCIAHCNNQAFFKNYSKSFNMTCRAKMLTGSTFLAFESIQDLSVQNGSTNHKCYDNCKSQLDWKLNVSIGSDSSDFNITEPYLLCQEFSENYNYGIVATVIASWNVAKSTSFTLWKPIFIVEMAKEWTWSIVKLTENTFLEIPNLNVSQKYRLRVSAVLSLHSITEPVYSDWIQVSAPSVIVAAPLSVSIIDYQIDGNYVDVLVSWIPSKDLPCFYEVAWFPSSGTGFYNQRTVSMYMDELPVPLTNLLLATNYSLEVMAQDASGKRRTQSASIDFVTPCRYFSGDPNLFNSPLCDSDRPQNLSTVWQLDTSELLIQWSAPVALTEDLLNVTSYSITVWHEEPAPKNIFFNQLVPGNVTELHIKNITPSRSYVIEVYALVKESRGANTVSYFNMMALTGSQAKNLFSKHIWTFAVIIIICMVLIILISWLKKRHLRKSIDLEAILWANNSNTTEEICIANIPRNLRPYIIPAHKVTLQERLGNGAFAVVYKGILSIGTSEEVVAVKEFSSHLVDDVERKIKMAEHEAEIIRTLGRHRHIISLRGITYSDNVRLLLEYCPLGNLLTWLKHIKIQLDIDNGCASGSRCSSPNHPSLNANLEPNSSQVPVSGCSRRNFDVETFGSRALSFMYQVTKAMEHMSLKKLIHCDIAARNVLLYDENIVKISDFGLARVVNEGLVHDTHEDRRWPIRWVSLETLESKKFFLTSDTWSFGILVWEVASLGMHPYPDLQNEQILPSLQQGIRMKRPLNCSEELYDLMLSCWLQEPDQRPTCSVLKAKLESMLEKKENYLQF